MTVLPPTHTHTSRRFQPLAGPLRARVTARLRRRSRRPPVARGTGRTERLRAAEPRSRSSPQSYRGGRGGRGTAAPGVVAGGGGGVASGCLAPSLLPALARPGATPSLPGPPQEREGLARPARRAPDKGRKRGRSGTRRPAAAPVPSLPPRASAAAASSFPRSEPTPGSGRSKPRRGWEGTEQGRCATEEGETAAEGREGRERERSGAGGSPGSA